MSFALSDYLKYIWATSGIAHVTFQQSEIEFNNESETIEIVERNSKSYGLSEGFVYFGGAYDFYNSGKFTLGVKVLHTLL